MFQQHSEYGEPVSINGVHRAYRKCGLDLDAGTAHLYIAGTMMIVATMGSIVVFILSVTALQCIYGWYPQFVAQQWFMYDQLFTVFSFLGLTFGALATARIMAKGSSMWAVASSMVCTLSGASVFVVSLVQPLAVLWQSLLCYFLPLFIAPLTGTLLIYLQAEDTDEVHASKESRNAVPKEAPVQERFTSEEQYVQGEW
jgi:hypothetical protein